MTRNSEFNDTHSHVPSYSPVDPDGGSFDDKIIRLDRNSTRGEMSGDIAHEINNYLAILSGNFELIPLMIKRGQLDKLVQKTEVMRRTIERIAMFCDGLMDQNAGSVNFHSVDLNELILNVLPFLKPQNPFDGVTIETRLSGELPPVNLDHVMIRQVLIDLLLNAADALVRCDGEKRIVISTEASTRGDERQVVIEVSDSGEGVPAHLVANLFERTFTTKLHGRGIGLLACRHIVGRHHGKLRYHFSGGARFIVELPINQPVCQSALFAPESESVPVTC